MCPPCPRTCVHHVSGPYRRTQKEPKGPRPIVRPSLRSGSLAPDLLRGHAATGHPWPRRGSPGIHAGRPTPQHLLSASREGWQIKNTAPRGGRPAGLFGSCVLRNRGSCYRNTATVGASLLAKVVREQARSHNRARPATEYLQRLPAHVFSGFFSQVSQLLGR